MKLYENTSSGSLVIPCEQTDRRMDRHDEANGHLKGIPSVMYINSYHRPFYII